MSLPPLRRDGRREKQLINGKLQYIGPKSVVSRSVLFNCKSKTKKSFSFLPSDELWFECRQERVQNENIEAANNIFIVPFSERSIFQEPQSYPRPHLGVFLNVTSPCSDACCGMHPWSPWGRPFTLNICKSMLALTYFYQINVHESSPGDLCEAAC